LTLAIYEITAMIPREELYGLKSTATMQFLDPSKSRRGMRKIWRRRIRIILGSIAMGSASEFGVSPLAG